MHRQTEFQGNLLFPIFVAIVTAFPPVVVFVVTTSHGSIHALCNSQVMAKQELPDISVEGELSRLVYAAPR